MALPTMSSVPKENVELDSVPGTFGVPVFGDTFHYMSDSLAWARRNQERYGDVFRVNAFFLKGIVVLGPDALKTVFHDRESTYSTALGWAPFFYKLFPSSLPMRDGDDHRFNRRIVQEAFKKNAMQGYVDVINPVAHAGLAAWQPQKSFRFYPAIKQLALDVSAAVFMGIDLGEESRRANRALLDLVKAVGAVFHTKIPGTTYWKGLKGRETLCNMLRPHIEAKRRSTPTDLFGHLCHAQTEEGAAFSDQEILDHTIAIMFASHDTTTSILTSMVYWLAQVPEWQAIVRDECRSLNKAMIEYDDLDRMEKMEWVFKEGLRLHPPVDLAQRRTLQDTEINGYRIPANTIVMAGIGYTHRMEKYWNDPDRFDPARFSPSRAEDKQHPFLWAPFGGGAHKCIGMHFAYMNVKAIMHQLLMRYEIRLAKGKPSAYQSIPVKPRDDLPVIISPLEI